MSLQSLSSFSLLKQRQISLAEALACVVGGLASLGLYRLVQRYVAWWCSPLRQLPGPPCRSFLWGVFPAINKEPFMAPHKRWIAQAGPEAKLIYYSTILGQGNLLVVDKDITKQVLTAPAGKNNNRCPSAIRPSS